MVRSLEMVKRFFSVLYKDINHVYGRYPKPAKTFTFILILILLTAWFKPLWTLIVFILIDRLFVFLERNTSFELKLEHVTIVAVITGYQFPMVYSLLITAIMMMILQLRNIKFSFLGMFIDGSIWFFICLVASASSHLGIAMGVLAFAIPIGRFVVKLLINFFLGFQPHDLHKDTMNMLYQIFFLKYLTPFLFAIIL